MLQEAEAALKRWHDKTQQPPLEGGMPTTQLGDAGIVMNAVREMRRAAKFAEEKNRTQSRPDPRWLRINLWLEENAEKIEACIKGDVIETLDGICDSLYVDVGAAHRFNMDISGAFAEVCASNDSKQFTGDSRVRDKGPNYFPPNLLPFVKPNV